MSNMLPISLSTPLPIRILPSKALETLSALSKRAFETLIPHKFQHIPSLKNHQTATVLTGALAAVALLTLSIFALKNLFTSEQQKALNRLNAYLIRSKTGEDFLVKWDAKTITDESGAVLALLPNASPQQKKNYPFVPQLSVNKVTGEIFFPDGHLLGRLALNEKDLSNSEGNLINKLGMRLNEEGAVLIESLPFLDHILDEAELPLENVYNDLSIKNRQGDLVGLIEGSPLIENNPHLPVCPLNQITGEFTFLAEGKQHVLGRLINEKNLLVNPSGQWISQTGIHLYDDECVIYDSNKPNPLIPYSEKIACRADENGVLIDWRERKIGQLMDQNGNPINGKGEYTNFPSGLPLFYSFFCDPNLYQQSEEDGQLVWAGSLFNADFNVRCSVWGTRFDDSDWPVNKTGYRFHLTQAKQGGRRVEKDETGNMLYGNFIKIDAFIAYMNSSNPPHKYISLKEQYDPLWKNPT